MTTIAISDGFIVADGLRTWGSEIRGRAHKKIRVVGSLIYAFTGLVPMQEPMIEWHRAGADPTKLPHGAADDKHGGWTLIVIDKDGIGKYTDGCPYLERFDPPIAFGAGQDYAIGAMLVGASAQHAVEAVASLCNHTGGEIQVVDIASVLGAARKNGAARSQTKNVITGTWTKRDDKAAKFAKVAARPRPFSRMRRRSAT